jgi:hypothetical protein
MAANTACTIWNAPGAKLAEVSQHRRLLGREVEAAGAGFVIHVVTSRLGVQPLAHAPLFGAGLLGQFGGGEGAAARERVEQAQAITKHDQGGAQTCPKFAYDPGSEVTVRHALLLWSGHLPAPGENQARRRAFARAFEPPTDSWS